MVDIGAYYEKSAIIDSFRKYLENPTWQSNVCYLSPWKNVFNIALPEFKGLIFKTGDGGTLEKELEKAKEVFSRKEGYEYTEPLFTFAHNNSAYLVLREVRTDCSPKRMSFSQALRHIQGTLKKNEHRTVGIEWWDNDEIYTNAKRIYAKRALNLIAKMQAAFNQRPSGPGIFERYDYHAKLEAKLAESSVINPFIVNIGETAASYLVRLPRVFAHGDLHLENIMAIGNGETCGIDFQSSCYANRFFDIAYLLEQSEFGLEYKTKMELLDYFVSLLEEKGDSVQEDILTAYDYNAAFICVMGMCLFSSGRMSIKYSRQECERRARWYHSNVEQAIKRIAERRVTPHRSIFVVRL